MKFVAQVSGLSGRGYDARAQECGLRTVRDSLDRADMIQVYRIMSGIDKSDPSKYFKPAQLRGGATSTLSSSIINKQGDTNDPQTYGTM